MVLHTGRLQPYSKILDLEKMTDSLASYDVVSYAKEFSRCSTWVGSSLARKYKTRLKVTVSNKLSSYLNCIRKVGRC